MGKWGQAQSNETKDISYVDFIWECCPRAPLVKGVKT